MKRYELNYLNLLPGCPAMFEDALGAYALFADVDAALSARDARIAELEAYQRDSADRLAHMVRERAALESHLAACKAECRAWREWHEDRWIRFMPTDQQLKDDEARRIERANKRDAAVAATDAAGGVA